MSHTPPFSFTPESSFMKSIFSFFTPKASDCPNCRANDHLLCILSRHTALLAAIESEDEAAIDKLIISTMADCAAIVELRFGEASKE
jgi:hypothetical protein